MMEELVPENRDDLNDRLLQETHDAVIEMKAIVLGSGGRGGLVGDLAEVQLSVKEMVLRQGNTTVDVRDLLQKVPKIEKEIRDVADELHEPKVGVGDRMATLESEGRDRQRMLKWVLGIMAVVGTGLLAMMAQHVLRE